jgi:hypothetical protein
MSRRLLPITKCGLAKVNQGPAGQLGGVRLPQRATPFSLNTLRPSLLIENPQDGLHCPRCKVTGTVIKPNRWLLLIPVARRIDSRHARRELRRWNVRPYRELARRRAAPREGCRGRARAPQIPFAEVNSRSREGDEQIASNRRPAWKKSAGRVTQATRKVDQNAE